MLALSLGDICSSTRGVAGGGLDALVATGVSIDSRTVKAGDLFFALTGGRVDGHTFVGDALARGAVAAVVSRTNGDRTIRVADTGDALVDLARLHRRRISAEVIGITGSNGKTSTKEMLASISSVERRTHKAAASFNNRIGVPLTLFEIEGDTEVAIIEMGTNHPGEIEELCGIADPRIGVITTVSEAHLEGLGDLDGVIRAKGEMALHIRRQRGLLVINTDDPNCRELMDRYAGDVLGYGLEDGADVRALEVKEGRRGYTFFVRTKGWFRVEHGGLPGVYSALAAIAVASHLGIRPSSMREGIMRYTPPPMRMQSEVFRGITLVNDAYNANPQSSRAALDSLTRRAAPGRRLFVLGDMLELGRSSRSLHVEFGRDVAASDVSSFWTLGPQARWAADGALRGGMNAKQVFPFQSPDCMRQALAAYLQPGDTVLFKASRGVRLEEIASGVKDILHSGKAMGRAG